MHRVVPHSFIIMRNKEAPKYPSMGSKGCKLHNHTKACYVAKRRRLEHLGSIGSGRVLAAHPVSHFLPWGAELIMKTGEVGDRSSPLAEGNIYI